MTVLIFFLNFRNEKMNFKTHYVIHYQFITNSGIQQQILIMQSEQYSCGLIKDWKTRYCTRDENLHGCVVVGLKIGKHDIKI